MGAKFGYRRRQPAADSVAIAGRWFVIRRFYEPKSSQMRKAKQLLEFDPNHPRYPGGRVVYKTATSVRAQTCAGKWWAAEMHREARE